MKSRDSDSNPQPPHARVRPTAPLMSLRGISKVFGRVHALRDIDLDLYPREILAVVGDNGAGKSTLVKIASGFLQQDSGIILWEGKTVVLPSIVAAQDLGIVSVFQDSQLCENLDVSANVFLGRERKHNHMLDTQSMLTETCHMLNLLTAPIPPASPVNGLSAGQRQTVTIARTLLGNPKLVVLDEPTASLSVTQTAEVLNHIENLRSMGKSVVLIGHNLPDIFAVSDRIAVLRHGRLESLHETSETTYEEVIAEIAGAPEAGKVVRASLEKAVDGYPLRHRLPARGTS